MRISAAPKLPAPRASELERNPAPLTRQHNTHPGMILQGTLDRICCEPVKRLNRALEQVTVRLSGRPRLHNLKLMRAAAGG
jgi:hypothetical protein